MGKYIIKRILMGIITIFVLITVTFFLTRWMPGNPFQSNEISEGVLQEMEEEYGLHDPVYIQYVNYMDHLLHGDLGVSFKKPGVAVNEVIRRGMPATLSLGLLALLLALVIGIPFGIGLAMAKTKKMEHLLRLGTSLGVGIPNFVTAIILLLIFGVWLKWLPIAGLTRPTHYILPVISLAVYPASMIARYMEAAFLDTINQDYILMAKTKKLPKKYIIRRHILKNAMIPVINCLGPMLAFLLTGSFVVESIFTIPGLGREFVNSIANRDYTLIMGLVIFMGTIVIIVQLLIDIICSFLDPRIRLSNYD
ncbi:MAG: ABC transporter permease [Lachnospiraceae bacterium]